MIARSVISPATTDLLPPRAPHAARPRTEYSSPHSEAGPRSPGAPQGGDQAHSDEGDISLAPCGPSFRRTASPDPDVSLGPLGWLAVLLVAVLLAVLAHAASMRSDLSQHREPPSVAEPALLLAPSPAEPAPVLAE